jgi:DNA-binding beta-propeller fold protein YncE
MRAAARIDAVAPRAARWTAALVLSLLAGAGCGSKFELPMESPRTLTPGEDSYFVKYRWAGFAGATDVLMTRGGRVFVAEPRPEAPESLRVRGYFRSKRDPTPTGLEVAGVGQPVRLAEGGDGALFVLDAAQPPSVKRYSADGRTFRAAFSDPAWEDAVDDTSRPNFRTVRITNTRVSLRGLAVDSDDDVYVAWTDSTFLEDINLIDSTLIGTSIVVGDTIRKYSLDGVPLLDVATRGTGTGFVDGPGGLAAHDGALYFADTNKNWIQKVDANAVSRPLLVIDGLELEEPAGFLAPLDVAVDDSGSIYVADTGNARVLKFDADGTLVLRVDADSSNAGGATQTEEPIAVTVNSELALVLDRRLGLILTYELRNALDAGGR